jgi:DNA-binding transcriptional MerR regulator
MSTPAPGSPERKALRIGELCARTGATPRMVRHYERAGVLTPKRTANRYRVYDEEDVRTVEDVRCLLAAGLTLTESAQIIEAICAQPNQVDDADRAAALLLIGHRRDQLSARIDQLAEFRDRLDELRTEIVEDGQSAVGA